MNVYNNNKANIGEVRERLSEYVALAEKGQPVTVCRRNRPVARLVRVEDTRARNRTVLGSDRGSVTVHCDLTAPAMAEKDWNALR